MQGKTLAALFCYCLVMTILLEERVSQVLLPSLFLNWFTLVDSINPLRSPWSIGPRRQITFFHLRPSIGWAGTHLT